MQSWCLKCYVVCAIVVVVVVLWIWRTPTNDRPLQVIYNEAVTAIERGNYATVRSHIANLQKLPTSTAACYAKLLSARLQLSAGDPQAAIREFSSISCPKDLHSESLLVLGECFYKLHDYVESQRLFFHVANEEPNNEKAHRWLSAVYYDLGAYALARVHLVKLTELRPHDFAPYRLLGLMSRDAGDHKIAIEMYQKCIERGPPNDIRVEVIHELAESMIALLDFTSALDVLKTIPVSGPTEVLKAQAHLGLGETEAAERCLEVAYPQCRNEPLFLLQRARTKIARGDWEAAAVDADHARRLDPYNPEILYVLATAKQYLNLNDESQKLMKESLALRDLVARLSQLSREAEQNGSDPLVRDELSRISAQLGKKELAAMWARAADACRKGKSQQIDAR